MIICRNCHASLPDGCKFCNRCGYQTGELPIAPFSRINASYDAPDYIVPDSGNEEIIGPIPRWDNALPTEPGSYPREQLHPQHQQPLPNYASHHQPLQIHDAHHQANPIHGAHHQAAPIHGAHHQPQGVHGLHHQPVVRHAGHLRKAQHGCRPSCLTMVISSLMVVSVFTVTLLIAYFNSQHNVSANPASTPSNINLVTIGKPVPGQTLQVVGNHFTPRETVVVTVDGQPLAQNGVVATTLRSSALNMFLTNLSAINASGTPVTVQADGTFIVTIHIDTHWNIGSTHHLRVDNQQGKELKSLSFTVESNQSLPVSHPTPAPTSNPKPTPNPTSPPVPNPTPTPTPNNPPAPKPSPTLPPAPNPIVRTLITQQAQSQTVNATGQGTTPGTPATGTIKIQNFDTENALQLPAGTILNNTAGCTVLGLQINLDNAVNLNAYSGDGNYPFTTVPIHVVQPGVAGNIQDCAQEGGLAFDSCSSTCDSNSIAWEAFDGNGGFAGGTDPQPYTAVQQSDIDSAANSLAAATTQTAVADINSQLQSNEHLVGDPQCSSQASSDHVAGDQASSVTVTVQTSCTATAST